MSVFARCGEAVLTGAPCGHEQSQAWGTPSLACVFECLTCGATFTHLDYADPDYLAGTTHQLGPDGLCWCHWCRVARELYGPEGAP